MTRIVVYAHRPKRPPRKKKTAAAPGPAIVKVTPAKRLKWLRLARRIAEPSPEIDAFFERNVRPGGP